MIWEMKDLIEAVRDHALRNYSKNGWDNVVEAYTDEELMKTIGKATTPKGAIKAVRKVIIPYHNYAEDIRGCGV